MKFLKRRRKNVLFLCLMLLFSVCIGWNVKAAEATADSKPYIKAAKLINEQDIEFYWSEDVIGADIEDYFSVTVDDKANKIYSYTWEEYNQTEKGIVYYNQKTSIRLTDPITNLTTLPNIKVTVAGDKIKNAAGTYADQQVISVTTHDPFYEKERVMDCGVKILGTEKVSDEAMDKAKEMMEVILSNEEIATRMGQAGCMLGIYGEGEIAYDIPEHRYSYDENYLYVEGFGGTQLASIKDANVLRLTTGDYTTNYTDECILVHEFGHTIQNFGLSEQQSNEWENIFASSVTNGGKWSNSYAGSNSSEYFATLTAIWFNVMNDTSDGQWDGVRGPINTREELQVYDKDAYDFLSKIYPVDQYLPEPWKNGSVTNNYNYTGTGDEGGDQPGTGDEGGDQPGSGDQGGDQPGSGDEGGDQPGSGDQGGDQPGSGDQGGSKPDSGEQGGSTSGSGSTGGSSTGSGSTGGSSTGAGGASSDPTKDQAGTPNDEQKDKDVTTTQNPDGSKKEVVKEQDMNSKGKEVTVTTTTETDSKGKVISVTEKSKIDHIASDTSATVTVKTDGKGEVTSATATVSKNVANNSNKVTISANVIDQIKEAAGTDVDITMTVKGADGKTKYKLKVDTADLKTGKDLYIYQLNTKTGEYTMVNSKTYSVSKKGSVSVNMDANATYELLSAKEAKKIEKQILSTVKVEKSSASIKKGEKTAIVFSSSLNMKNVKSISYSTSSKSVATVSKSGSIITKKEGTTTINAKITLKNGITKTVKMKITVE